MSLSFYTLIEADYQKVIHQVEVPIVDFNTCQEWYSAQEVTISDTMLCAGFAEGQKDACQVTVLALTFKNTKP